MARREARVLEIAQRNGAPHEVMRAIESIDRPNITGPNQVVNALWKIV